MIANSESRSQKIIDDNLIEIRKNHFRQIKFEKNSEYQNLLAEVAERFPVPEQYNRALQVISNGLASDVSEALTLLQQEDFDDRNTHR